MLNEQEVKQDELNVPDCLCGNKNIEALCLQLVQKFPVGVQKHLLGLVEKQNEVEELQSPMALLMAISKVRYQ